MNMDMNMNMNMNMSMPPNEVALPVIDDFCVHAGERE